MDSSVNRRIAKNSIILYVRLLITIIIGLWSSRILLQNLGISDYGLYNVVGGVISMFCFVSGSLSSAASRYITYNINNEVELKQIFSTIKAIHLLFALIIILLGETVGLWLVLNKLNYPENREFAVLCVYQFSIVTAVLNIINTPYNALLIAHENVSIYAITTLGSSILRFIVTILIAYVSFDGLIFYAAAYMSILLMERIFVQLYSKHKYSEARSCIKLSKGYCRQILGFSFWTVIGNLAIICYTQGLNILLNMFFGSVVNAARGVAVQVQTVVMQFCTNFQMALNPQIVKSYAAHELVRMHRLVIICSKFSFFLLSIVVIPIIYNIDIILKLWLDKVPEYANDFVCVILIITLIATLSNPLVISIQATGNIKKFQIYEGTCLLTILPLSYLLLRFFDVPPISVFIVNLLVIIVAQVIRVRIILPRIQMSIGIYIRKVIYPTIGAFFICNILPYTERIFLYQNIYSLLIIAGTSVVYSIIVVFFIGCDKEERYYILTKLHVLYDRYFRRK